MKRRDFLKLAAAATVAPAIWIPGCALARTAAHGRVKHLLVLYAKGGFRSHAVFNAVGTKEHNPWGAQQSPAQWALGAACGSADISTPGGTIDGFAKRTGRVAVLASIDHQPGTPNVDADHRTASLRMGTGAPDGTNGLLTLIGRYHPKYASGFSLDAVPPVEIGPSEFGLGAAELSRYRPLTISAPEDSFGEDLLVRSGWNAVARDRLNARYMAGKPAAYARRLESFDTAKQNATKFAGMLSDPRLNVIGAPDVAHAGFSNAQLLEILGSESLGIAGDPEDARGWGPRVAMALRFFGFGTPACVVTHDIYDMHDRERDSFGPRTADLTRQLAGLEEILRRMPHPEGGNFWDSTMVAVVSEFSRNNTNSETGFNSGNGSDHVEERPAACRNQAIAVMGGAVTAGGKLIGATDADMNPTGSVFGSRQLLATFLDVLGIEPDVIFPDHPIEELFS